MLLGCWITSSMASSTSSKAQSRVTSSMTCSSAVWIGSRGTAAPSSASPTRRYFKVLTEMRGVRLRRGSAKGSNRWYDDDPWSETASQSATRRIPAFVASDRGLTAMMFNEFHQKVSLDSTSVTSKSPRNRLFTKMELRSRKKTWTRSCSMFLPHAKNYFLAAPLHKGDPQEAVVGVKEVEHKEPILSSASDLLLDRAAKKSFSLSLSSRKSW